MSAPEEPVSGRFGPVGQCIYCRSDNVTLNIEHIIPYSLDGTLELLAASCDICTKATHAFEGHVAGQIFGDWRFQADFPSRRRTKRAATVDVNVISGRTSGEIPIDRQDYRAFVPIIRLERPNIFDRRSEPEEFIMHCDFAATKGLSAKDMGVDFVIRKGQINPSKFCRMLAKIAHGYAVLSLGIDGFDHLLTPMILKEGERIFWYVGGYPEIAPALNFAISDTIIHALLIWQKDSPDGESLVGVDIQLFANLRDVHPDVSGSGMPIYSVVVGNSNSLTGERFGSGFFYPKVSKRSGSTPRD
ncbi:hypothetical protein [Sphingomonas sp. G-3-2-10]|uniref:hypothetical protein n=1 Tax=Sphingomonas sp. G-3-2-10 TaxID=2728838 RepID=UPI001469A41A|nr:hypothetical protein [Sphingomonas sp. G-3-2-10]NML06977.1 HNH endonuclease [Sphingomonas sp. G-3-2-10]